MMRNIIAAALVAAAPPPAAGADSCPTASDMQGGVLLSMSEDSFAMRSRITDDSVVVTSIVTDSTGAITETTTHYRHPLALPRHPGAITEIEISYTQPVDGLDDLLRTREWTSEFQFSRDGELFETGVQVSRLTALGQIGIGDCFYDVWRVNRQLSYSDGGSLYSEQVYAPDLGIIVSETTLDADGTPRATVIFDRISAM